MGIFGVFVMLLLIEYYLPRNRLRIIPDGSYVRISYWTSIPLLSTLRRGGSKEGVVFSGVFLLDCSLENSVRWT